MATNATPQDTDRRVLLNLDPGKPLNIEAVETAINELLERYRQAFRAGEFLPGFGAVSRDQFIRDIPTPVYPEHGWTTRAKRAMTQARTRNADWFRIRLAVRSLVLVFLRSHIRSMLFFIADRLEVERLARAHLDANELRRVETAIELLRDSHRRLASRTATWIRLLASSWAIATPILIAFVTPLLTTYFQHPIALNIPSLLVNIGTFLALFALLLGGPLYLVVGLGGFRWKRLILVGQPGDVNIDIAADAVLRWTLAPSSNTYHSENRLFETLGLPKPEETPWDQMLSPLTIWLGAWAWGTFLFAWAIVIPSKQLGWPMLIAVALFVVCFLCLNWMVRLIARTAGERSQRGAR